MSNRTTTRSNLLAHLNTTFSINFDSVFTTSYVINYLDYAVRILAVLVHLIYIYFMFRVKKFRSRTYFYMHNVIIVSLVYVFHYACYTGTGGPTFRSLELNLFFCYLSEQIWSILKYMRAFSILLLAFYRLIAVKNINLYKKMNSGLSFILFSILGSLITSLILTFVLKYAFNTTYSVYFCSPGYSDNIKDMIIAFILNIFISNILPTVVNLVAYFKIIAKLKLNRDSLNRNNNKEAASKTNKASNNSRITPNNESSMGTTNVFTTQTSANIISNASNTVKRDLNVKQSRFAKQFILMNLFIVLSNLFSVIVDFLIVLATNPAFYYLDALLWQFRPIARILFLIFQSMIPVLSILFNPEVKFMKIFEKGNFLKRGFLCNSSII
ncbi:unnamed protein product [Brachionus calyciflorus]|uniref:G-protein coupled receptors family 1 profile domain-containing protein n=1 Tax=Brachionus calyciflorus TaxID=104777 RepID=A0A814MAJ7_9BILA|nr:unnamed protein product [Brachionus calyciflorus]